MPARYVAMREKFSKNMGYDAAQTKAAKIYNATRKAGEPAMSSGAEYDRKRRRRVREGLKRAFPA